MSGIDVKNAIGWAGGAMAVGGASAGDLSALQEEVDGKASPSDVLAGSGIAEGRATDVDVLRAIATRDLIGRQSGTAEGRASDVSVLRQPVARGKADHARLDIIDIDWEVSGFTVNIRPGRSAFASAGRAIYFGGAVAIPAVTVGNVVGEVRTLTYNNTPAFVFAAGGRLDHARVSNVVVKSAGGAVLALGADYALNADQGAVMRAAAGDPLPVTVDYTWSAIRYDLIEVGLDGTVYVKQGMERVRDVAEYLPVRTAGRVPVLVVRVTAAGLTVWRWYDPEEASHSTPALIQRARARNMGSFRKALQSGNPVVIAGYGDSRTCIGGTTAYTPNGPTRDIATSSYLEAQSADFKASLPLFDHGDGAGQVHTHVGWNWDLLRAIERLYPNDVSYLNFGIGGTTSGNTANGGTIPARLAALTASGATVATIAFGMNELGATAVDTIANLITIGDACRAAGIDPVFIAPARPNLVRAGDTLGQWIVENRQVQAAADYLLAPFVDALPLYGGDRVQGMLDPREMCSSNLYNHDSVYELGLIGRALTPILLDI